MTAIEAIKRQHQHQKDIRRERLDAEAAKRQQEAEQLEDENIDSVSMEENRNYLSQPMDAEEIPPVPEEREQTVAFLSAAPGSKRRRLQIHDGNMDLDIPLSGNALITTSLTPSKALARQQPLQTPEKDPSTSSKRGLTLDDRDKIEILDLWIYFAQEPFETKRNSVMLADCDNIQKHCQISRGPLKGVYKDPTSIAELLTGRKMGKTPGKGLKVGPKKHQGLLIYISGQHILVNINFLLKCGKRV